MKTASPPILAAMSVSDVAAHFGVDPAKVRVWIARGELRAINVATITGGRTRLRILQADLLAFEAARAAVPLPRIRTRRRKTDWTPTYF